MKIKTRYKEYDISDIIFKHLPALLSSRIAFLFLKLFGSSKKSNTLVFFGHRFNGNLIELAKWINSQNKNYKIAFLCDEPSYYRILRKAKPFDLQVYLCQNPLHLIKCFHTKAIITSHGPMILDKWSTLNKRPKFIDLWHGAGFKDRSQELIKPMIFYDGHFLPSDTYANFYEKWGFPKTSLFCTGYARSDQLVKYDADSDENLRILNRLGIPANRYKKIVLIALTWRKSEMGSTVPFDIDLNVFLKELNRIGKDNAVLFIFSTHINTSIKKADFKMSNVNVLFGTEFSDSEDLLKITNILVTDWSSIYTDFLVLKRPVIFIKNEAPFKGFTLLPSDRAGKLVETFEEFEKIVTLYINQPQKYYYQYKYEYEKAKEKIWNGTLDGYSSKRCYNKLLKIIKNE
ncbi:MAG: CDP-glycerol glycerophosphotransferase family protein [Candidatus Dojkabacteria bacterium]|nr:CDP-glycerol glycerophosphotransferase family protein [Candidatus Dojkabacteria bacterium]